MSDNNQVLIELAYSKSKERLEAQLQIALSCDQRSLVFSTLSIAAAALIFRADDGLDSFFTGAAVFYCLGSIFAAFSAFPQKQYLNGSHGKDLRGAIEADSPYHGVLLGLVANNDWCIDQNESLSIARNRFYRFAIFLFLIASVLVLLGLNFG